MRTLIYALALLVATPTFASDHKSHEHNRHCIHHHKPAPQPSPSPSKTPVPTPSPSPVPSPSPSETPVPVPSSTPVASTSHDPNAPVVDGDGGRLCRWMKTNLRFFDILPCE